MIPTCWDRMERKRAFFCLVSLEIKNKRGEES